MTLATKTSATRILDFLAPTAAAFPALRAIVRTFLNRRAAFQVSELPDYLLNDIGLKRDDVHEALNVRWRDDATYRMALSASRRRRENSLRRP